MSRSRRRAACSISPLRSTATVRATNGASAALVSPVPQPRSPIVQRESISAGSACSAEAAPNSSRRSRSHCPAADAKNSSDLLCRRPSTPFSRRASWSAPGRRRDLLAQQRPEPPRVRVALVERERVVAAGAVAARRDPARVRQRLQVPADGRLRQLQHGAQLGHRQLVPLENEQHPAPRRIRQRGQVVKNRGLRHRTSALTLCPTRAKPPARSEGPCPRANSPSVYPDGQLNTGLGLNCKDKMGRSDQSPSLPAQRRPDPPGTVVCALLDDFGAQARVQSRAGGSRRARGRFTATARDHGGAALRLPTSPAIGCTRFVLDGMAGARCRRCAGSRVGVLPLRRATATATGSGPARGARRATPASSSRTGIRRSFCRGCTAAAARQVDCAARGGRHERPAAGCRFAGRAVPMAHGFRAHRAADAARAPASVAGRESARRRCHDGTRDDRSGDPGRDGRRRACVRSPRRDDRRAPDRSQRRARRRSRGGTRPGARRASRSSSRRGLARYGERSQPAGAGRHQPSVAVAPLRPSLGPRESSRRVMTREKWTSRKLGTAARGARERLVERQRVGGVVPRRADHVARAGVQHRGLCCPATTATSRCPRGRGSTLDAHRGDRREHRATPLAQFDAASTHDPLWNAVQRQLRAGRLVPRLHADAVGQEDPRVVAHAAERCAGGDGIA